MQCIDVDPLHGRFTQCPRQHRKNSDKLQGQCYTPLYCDDDKTINPGLDALLPCCAGTLPRGVQAQTHWLNFGTTLGSRTRLAGHPLCFIPDYKNKVVPLRLHGDGMPAARGDSLDVLSLGSVVGL